MRIAIVISTYPPYQGGMGNVARDHAAWLAAAGHEVTVFTPGSSASLRLGNSAVMPQLLWRLRGFDAVELHYPFFGGAEWVWLWKKIFGRRARLTVFYHMDTVGSGLTGLVYRLYRALFLKLIMRSADRIAVTSRDYAAASQVSEWAGSPKTVAIPPAVDLDQFSPDSEPPARPAALFVGALDRAHYFKGVEVLLRAFATIEGASELLIVGDGDLRPGYEALANNLGLAKRVTFLGPVTNERLPDVYRRASFHVLPSIDRSEAFGLVTLEAAASGLASIVSDLPGVRAAVAPGETGFTVPPGDERALADAMRRLFADPQLARDMGLAARRRAESLYSSAAVARSLVAAVVE